MLAQEPKIPGKAGCSTPATPVSRIPVHTLATVIHTTQPTQPADVESATAGSLYTKPM